MGKARPLAPREILSLSDEMWGKIEVVYSRMRELNELMEHFRKESGGDMIIWLAISFFIANVKEE